MTKNPEVLTDADVAAAEAGAGPQGTEVTQGTQAPEVLTDADVAAAEAAAGTQATPDVLTDADVARAEALTKGEAPEVLTDADVAAAEAAGTAVAPTAEPVFTDTDVAAAVPPANEAFWPNVATGFVREVSKMAAIRPALQVAMDPRGDIDQTLVRQQRVVGKLQDAVAAYGDAREHSGAKEILNRRLQTETARLEKLKSQRTDLGAVDPANRNLVKEVYQNADAEAGADPTTKTGQGGRFVGGMILATMAKFAPSVIPGYANALIMAEETAQGVATDQPTNRTRALATMVGMKLAPAAAWWKAPVDSAGKAVSESAAHKLMRTIANMPTGAAALMAPVAVTEAVQKGEMPSRKDLQDQYLQTLAMVGGMEAARVFKLGGQAIGETARDAYNNVDPIMANEVSATAKEAFGDGLKIQRSKDGLDFVGTMAVGKTPVLIRLSKVAPEIKTADAAAKALETLIAPGGADAKLATEALARNNGDPLAAWNDLNTNHEFDAMGRTQANSLSVLVDGKRIEPEVVIDLLEGKKGLFWSKNTKPGATAGTVWHEVGHALLQLADMRTRDGKVQDPKTGNWHTEESLMVALEAAKDHPLTQGLRDGGLRLLGLMRRSPPETLAKVVQRVLTEARERAAEAGQSAQPTVKSAEERSAAVSDLLKRLEAGTVRWAQGNAEGGTGNAEGVAIEGKPASSTALLDQFGKPISGTEGTLDVKPGQEKPTHWLTTPDLKMRVGVVPYWTEAHPRNGEETVITSDHPDFPPKLQGRNERSDSEEQVQEIASDPNPPRLLISDSTGHGPPMTDRDGNTISGNGRRMGLRKAYAQGTAGKYRQAVVDEAVQMGHPEVAFMREPVREWRLIDSRGEALDKVAEASNADDHKARAASEIALADARNIQDEGLMEFWHPDKSGNIRAESNNEFLKRFNQIIKGRGGINYLKGDKTTYLPELDKRVTDAMMAVALGDTSLAKGAIAEAMANGDKLGGMRIIDGIAQAAPELAKIAHLKPKFTLAQELSEALRIALDYLTQKKAGKVENPGQYFAQDVMQFAADKPLARDLARRMIDADSAKQVRELLTRYVDVAQKADTGPDMFGAKETTKAQLLQMVMGERERQGSSDKGKNPTTKTPFVYQPPGGAAPIGPALALALDNGPVLPKNLAGAKPRYSYGQKKFTLLFKSDMDKAAYIATQDIKSKRDMEYLDWTMKAGEMTKDQVKAYGRTVRDRIKAMARDAQPGRLTVNEVKPIDAGTGSDSPVNSANPNFSVRRVAGRPDLSQISPDERVRPMVMAVDELRNQAGLPAPQTMQEWATAAAQRMADNPGRAREDVLTGKLHYDGEDAGANTILARNVIDALGIKAFESGLPDDYGRIGAAVWTTRNARSHIAQAMRAGVDNLETPAQRNRRWVIDEIFAPSAKLDKALEAMPPAERIRAIAEEALGPSMQGMELDGSPIEQPPAARDLQGDQAAPSAGEAGRGQDKTAGTTQNAPQGKPGIDAEAPKMTPKRTAEPSPAQQVMETLLNHGIDLGTLTDAEWGDPYIASEIARVVQGAKSTRGERIYEYWRNSILSCVGTHLANVIGNTALGVYEYGARRPVEALLNIVDQHPSSMQMRELPGMYKALFGHIRQAADAAMTAFSTEMPSISGARIENLKVAIPGRLGRVVRLPQRLLLLADEFSKSMIVNAELWLRATRQAKSEGAADVEARTAEILQNPQAELYMRSKIMDEIHAEARRLTFQEPGEISNDLIRARNRGGLGWVLKFTVPFVVTPLNIAKIGIRQSPLGAFAMAYKATKGNYAGDVGHARMLRDAAEQILAAAATVALVGLVTSEDENGNPRITGSAQTFQNAGRKDLARRQGQPPPQSIRLGGRWYSYARAEPFATTATLVVDAINAFRNVENEDAGARAARLGNSMIGLVRDKTFLQGIGDLIRALQDDSKMLSMVQQLPASFVPNAALSIMRATDPVQRDARTRPRDDRSLGKEWMIGIGRRAFPVAALQNPPRRDIWGRIESNATGFGPATDFLWRTIVPIKTQRVTSPNNMDRMIANYNRQARNRGLEQWWPTMPDNTVELPGRPGTSRAVRMNPKEYDKFLARRAELFLNAASQKRWDFDKPQLRDRDQFLNIMNGVTEIAKQEYLQTRMAAPVTNRLRAPNPK